MQTYLHILLVKRLKNEKTKEKENASHQEKGVTIHPPIRTSLSIYHRTRVKGWGVAADKKKKGIINPASLKREMLLGILRTEGRPLAPFSSTVFPSLSEWRRFRAGCAFCLGGVLGSGEPRGARVEPRKREPETGCLGQILD